MRKKILLLWLSFFVAWSEVRAAEKTPSSSSSASPPTEDKETDTRSFYDLKPAEAEAKGRAWAREDFAKDSFEQVTYGLWSSIKSPYEEYLREHYGIRVHAVAGCLVSEGLLTGANSYNNEMQKLLNVKFGHDVFKEASEYAKRKELPAAMFTTLPHILFEEVDYSDVLIQFFQAKVTEIEKGGGSQEPRVTFELRCDQKKTRPPVTYQRENILLYDAFLEILHMEGLDYETISDSRIAIIDAPAKPTTKTLSSPK